MILTGKQIKWAKEQGYLDISDFDEKRLNPNSYNLRLANELCVYNEGILDMKKNNPCSIFTMRKDGYLLHPGKLYLARTMEWTETKKFIPMLEGRSSVGRLGIMVHATAGFGDVGFKGTWTLEISCVQPVVVYPGIEICQIYYHTIGPDYSIWIPDDNALMTYDKGKYQNQLSILPSRMWREFENER